MENDTQQDGTDYDYKQPEINYGNILEDIQEKGDKALKGTTTVESWKLFGTVATGFIYPTLPFTLAIGYGLYRFFKGLEEGRHYDTKKIKEVE